MFITLFPSCNHKVNFQEIKIENTCPALTNVQQENDNTLHAGL